MNEEKLDQAEKTEMEIQESEAAPDTQKNDTLPEVSATEKDDEGIQKKPVAAEALAGPASASQDPQTQFQLILEALLFATDEPLNIVRLKSILPGRVDARKIKAAVENINERLKEENHPFEVIEVAGGYQFRTRQYYHTWLRQLFKDRIARRLSQSALETLAVIAYKQPVTRAEIEAIRGVLADGAMKTLLERRLIKIEGRSEKPGRPLLYGTTKDFLRHFGLSHLEDLPKLEEFEELAKTQAQEEAGTMVEDQSATTGESIATDDSATILPEFEEAENAVFPDKNQAAAKDDETQEEIQEINDQAVSTDDPLDKPPA